VHPSPSKQQVLSVKPLNCLCCCPVFELEDLRWDYVMIDLFREIFVQIEQIWKAPGSEMCDCSKEPVHEVQLQQRGCHGDEIGLQR